MFLSSHGQAWQALIDPALQFFAQLVFRQEFAATGMRDFPQQGEVCGWIIQFRIALQDVKACDANIAKRLSVPQSSDAGPVVTGQQSFREFGGG